MEIITDQLKHKLIDKNFWHGKRVLVTGCTGFKGCWLTIWLHLLNAKIYGYSLPPPTKPAMWNDLNLEKLCISMEVGDVRHFTQFKQYVDTVAPEIIIHLAAQSLVKTAYQNPQETYVINVMGTVNLFEIVKETTNLSAVINVTSDKCYENQEWLWGYRENDTLGGHDPYSASKSCAELITQSYYRAFIKNKLPIGVATARAGNVIGGGDWASARLLPDIVTSFMRQSTALIRHPLAVRPWQHVLESLSGYLVLAQKLYDARDKYSGAWNFAPNDSEILNVEQIVNKSCELWGEGATYSSIDENRSLDVHETNILRLDCSKARMLLSWKPVWSVDNAVAASILWYKRYVYNKDKFAMLEFTKQQILQYIGDS